MGHEMLGEDNLLVGRQALTMPTPISTMDQISALASVSDDFGVSYGACRCSVFNPKGVASVVTNLLVAWHSFGPPRRLVQREQFDCGAH